MLTDVGTLFKVSQWFHTCKRWHTAAVGHAALLPVSPFGSRWVIWAWNKVEDQQTDRHFCISVYASSRAYMLLLSTLINQYWFQIELRGGMKSEVCGRPTPSFVLLWKKNEITRYVLWQMVPEVWIYSADYLTVRPPLCFSTRGKMKQVNGLPSTCMDSHVHSGTRASRWWVW